MITTFVIELLAGVLQGVLSLVPTWGVDTSSLTQPAVAAGSLDGWVPEQFIFACLGILIAARLWGLLWGAVVWVYHQIPFNGGA